MFRLDDIRRRALAFKLLLLSMLGELRGRYDDRKALAHQRHARGQGNLVDTILVIGIAGVIGYIVLQIGSETEESADFTANSAFSNASASITEGFETSFGLLDVVFIAFMLAIVVGALLGLRGQRR